MLRFNNKVSVIMPAYNCSLFVGHSIESVLNQSYNNLELIIINDMSTDNTISILSEFECKDSRIRVFTNPVNKGVSYSRNLGISLAEGEWIAFIDSDDIWISSKLEKQIEMVITLNAKFVFTNSLYIDEFSKNILNEFKAKSKISYNDLLKQNNIPCSSVLILKSLGVFFEEDCDFLHEDYLAWLKILQKCNYAYNTNEFLLLYRKVSKSRSSKKLDSLKKNFLLYRKMNYNLLISILLTIRNIFFSLVKYTKIYLIGKKNVY